MSPTQPLKASPAKAQPLPAILLANDLLTGEVVFYTQQGWSRNPADAFIAREPQEAQALEQAGQLALRKNEVIELSLVDVTVSAEGLAVPNHFRERFKIKGPSHRVDLGKQAEFTS